MKEKKFEWEYIDDESNYVKTRYKEVEEISFYLRFLSSWFTPCRKCQEKLKELFENEDMILGNMEYKPPVEFRHRFVIDDNSWDTIETRKATKEDERRLGKYGIREEL